MKSADAIAKNLTLIRPGRRYDSISRIPETFPAVGALINIGPKAIPALVGVLGRQDVNEDMLLYLSKVVLTRIDDDLTVTIFRLSLDLEYEKNIVKRERIKILLDELQTLDGLLLEERE